MDSGELLVADRFWDEVALCGTPSEEYRDVLQAADAADSVVLGRFVSVGLGRAFQGGAEEDFYAEGNVTVDVEEVLRKQSPAEPVVSLVLARASADAASAIVEVMQANLPQERLVLLLHARMDRPEMPQLYRLHGAFMGLWTRTTRSAVDNPLAHDRCPDHYGSAIQATYLKGAGNVDELAALLRK